MYISENIIYNTIQIEKSDLQIKKLNIASLNLDDFNKRFYSNYKLEYLPPVFRECEPNEGLNRFIRDEISSLLLHFEKPNWSDSDFAILDLKAINDFKIDLYSLIEDRKSMFKLNKDNVFRLDLFLKRYSDGYVPLGVFSDEIFQYYKVEMKKIVSELTSILHLTEE